MNKTQLLRAFGGIHRMMEQKRDYLIELDARNGDGDLGISMDQGFAAAEKAIADSDATDLGRLLLAASKAFNEAAPSSLGTILSIGIMGMAKSLKGKECSTLAESADAVAAGVKAICDKTGTKPGEKTVVDVLVPASEAFSRAVEAGLDRAKALQQVKQAAETGCEATREMLPVHGRAAYYGDKLIGVTDGGAEAAKLLFAALADAFADG